MKLNCFVQAQNPPFNLSVVLFYFLSICLLERFKAHGKLTIIYHRYFKSVLLMLISTIPFQRALLSLCKALERSSMDRSDLEVRDACIQRFEYTYELGIKTIKRYIEQEMPLPEQVDQLNYRDLLRIAFEIGLIEQVAKWFQFREARNLTSHAYDESKAKTVFQVLPEFVKHAEYLLNEFDKRLGQS